MTTRVRINRHPRDVDEVAVERACDGDLGITLNRAEMLLAFAELRRRGRSNREAAAILGVSKRSVERWSAGRVGMPYRRLA